MLKVKPATPSSTTEIPVTVGSVSRSSDRIAVWDIAKGIGIILVVYGHCLRGLTSAGLISEFSFVRVTDYVIYTFHMPLFFFISGIFVRNAISKGTAQFWRNRLLTIVYPYLLWSILQGSLQVALAGSHISNTQISIDHLYVILWQPISPFWFLYALFFSSGIAYLTRSLNTVPLVALAAILFLLSHAIFPWQVADIAYANFYLSLGILVAAKLPRPESITEHASPIMLWGAFGVATAIGYLVHIPERMWVPSALLAIGAILASCKNIESHAHKLTRLLATIGRASMAIYVMHVLILGGMRALLFRVADISQPAVLIFLCTSMGVFIPIAVQGISDRLNISPLLGLPRLWQRKRRHATYSTNQRSL